MPARRPPDRAGPERVRTQGFPGTMANPDHDESTTPSVPVPSLPRIKRPRPRTQARDAAARPEPRVAELHAHGLTWVHLDAPDAGGGAPLAERYGWHPLDLEDVLSKRQRPKVDEYPELPLRRPPLPGLRQGRPAPERRRARRLRRARLPRHAAERRAAAGDAALPPLRGGRGAPRAALREGVGLPALPHPRRPLRLLLPDPRQDRAQARLGRGRPVREARRGGRARPLEREAGDHLLPEDHQAGALDAAPARAPRRAVPAARSSSSTSTTSSTRASGSGTCSTTTRRSSRRSRTRTSRSSRTARTTSCASSRS